MPPASARSSTNGRAQDTSQSPRATLGAASNSDRSRSRGPAVAAAAARMQSQRRVTVAADTSAPSFETRRTRRNRSENAFAEVAGAGGVDRLVRPRNEHDGGDLDDLGSSLPPRALFHAAAIPNTDGASGEAWAIDDNDDDAAGAEEFEPVGSHMLAPVALTLTCTPCGKTSQEIAPIRHFI
jgi:hypothetical protein